jgi:hypothetical protein
VRAGGRRSVTAIEPASRVHENPGQRPIDEEHTMNDKALAKEACDSGFMDGVHKSVDILLQGWVIAKTQTEKKQAVQRFQKGLELYKEAYRSAQQAIDEVFRDPGPPAANPTAPSA